MKRSGKLFNKTSYTSSVISFFGMLLLFAIDIPLAVAESSESIKLPATVSAKQSVVSGESVFGVVFSLLLQASEAGGQFEYAPFIRSESEENYAAVEELFYRSKIR